MVTKREPRIRAVLAALVAIIVAVVASPGCASDDADESESTGTTSDEFRIRAISKFIIEEQYAESPPTGAMAVKETYGDQTAWHTRGLGATTAPGLEADPARRSSPAAVSWDHDQRADLFWLGTDGTIQHDWSSDGGWGWGGQHSIGAPTGYVPVGTPAVVSGASGFLDIIILARNPSGQYAVFQKRWASWYWTEPPRDPRRLDYMSPACMVGVL